MSESKKEILSDGMPVRSEEIGFSAEELRECPGCGRANSPDRRTCIYCGVVIPGAQGGRDDRPVISRQLEAWERGLSLVARFGKALTSERIAAAAAVLGIDNELAAKVLRDDSCIPVARVAAEVDADEARRSFENDDIRITVVDEKKMRPDEPPTRLKGLEFRKGELVMTEFNRGEQVMIANDEVNLVVTGTIVNERIDRLEKRKRRGRSETSDEGHMTSSSNVVDIYGSRDMTAYRILEYGFDFSCLGDDKAPFASENIQRLVSKFASMMPNATIVDDYDRLRTYLDSIWPREERSDNRGVVRAGFFKSEIERSAITTNLSQFQYYSRIQRYVR